MAKKINPYVITTLATIFYVLLSSLIDLLLGRGFSLIGFLLGVVIFWAIFLLMWGYFNKKKKRKK